MAAKLGRSRTSSRRTTTIRSTVSKTTIMSTTPTTAMNTLPALDDACACGRGKVGLSSSAIVLVACVLGVPGVPPWVARVVPPWGTQATIAVLADNAVSRVPSGAPKSTSARMSSRVPRRRCSHAPAPALPNTLAAAPFAELVVEVVVLVVVEAVVVRVGASAVAAVVLVLVVVVPPPLPVFPLGFDFGFGLAKAAAGGWGKPGGDDDTAAAIAVVVVAFATVGVARIPVMVAAGQAGRMA